MTEQDSMSKETKMAIDFINESVKGLKIQLGSYVSSDLFNSEMRYIRKTLEDIHTQTVKTNGSVTSNTNWRVGNEKFIKNLRDEREATYRRYSELIFKLTVSGGVVLLGLDKLGII